MEHQPINLIYYENKFFILVIDRDFIISSGLGRISIYEETDYIKNCYEYFSRHSSFCRSDDDVMLANELLKFIPESKSIDTKVFAGALRAAFLTILNEKTIGTDIYNEVFKFIVRGIVQQLFKD